jgi:hypothetical protein
MCILVSDSPEELSRPSGVQMQAILRAYYPADADISASLLKDGASKSLLQAAIVAAISARGVDAGFARYSEHRGGLELSTGGRGCTVRVGRPSVVWLCVLDEWSPVRA